MSTGLGEVFHYLLVPHGGASDGSGGMSLTDIKTLQDWTLKPAMRSVAGVAEVNAWGGLNKQYQIRVDPRALKKYGLTFDQVGEQLEISPNTAASRWRYALQNLKKTLGPVLS